MRQVNIEDLQTTLDTITSVSTFLNTKESFCYAPTLKIAKVMKHFWEEPTISGTLT